MFNIINAKSKKDFDIYINDKNIFNKIKLILSDNQHVIKIKEFKNSLEYNNYINTNEVILPLSKISKIIYKDRKIIYFFVYYNSKIISKSYILQNNTNLFFTDLIENNIIYCITKGYIEQTSKIIYNIENAKDFFLLNNDDLKYFSFLLQKFNNIKIKINIKDSFYIQKVILLSAMLLKI
jgi:hypothetical protein